jgi:hypothetical protein
MVTVAPIKHYCAVQAAIGPIRAQVNRSGHMIASGADR